MKRWIMLGLLGGVLLVGGGAVFLLGTQAGLDFLVGGLRALYPTSLVLDSARGRLIGPLAIRGLEFRSQDFELVLPSGDLQWTPSALLRGALAVERLAVEGLRYTQLRTVPEVTEKRAPVSLPERLELPFAIRVQAISLRDLQIQATPDGEPLVIGEADFTAKYDRSGETQLALRVEAPVISLSGEIDIEAEGAYPVDGELRWDVRLPQYAPLRGRTRLAGTLQHLEINQIFEAPYSARGKFELFDPIESLRLRARVELNQTDLKAIRSDFPALLMGANLQLEGTSKASALEAELSVQGENLGELKGRMTSRLQAQKLSIDELVLSLTGEPARLTAQGEVDFQGEAPELVLALNWERLGWPLQGAPSITSPQGRLELSGAPDNLQASVNVAIGEKGRLDGRMSRDKDSIKAILDWQELTWPQHNPEFVSAEGKVNLSGSLDDFRLRLSGLMASPNTLPHPVGLTLNAHGKTTSVPGEYVVNLKSRATEPVVGNLDGTFDGVLSADQVRIDKLALALAEQRGQIQATGIVRLGEEGPDLDVSASWDGLRWPLDGEALITSTGGTVTAKGTLQDLNARVNAVVGQKGELRGSVETKGESFIGDFDWRDLAWPEPQAQVYSTRGNFTVKGSVNNYTVALESGVGSPDYGDGTLSLQGAGNQESLDLSEVALDALEGRLRGAADFAWAPEMRFSADLRGESFNPGRVLPDWPGNLGLSLKADGEMRDGFPVARIERLVLDGRLRDTPVDLEARGQYRGQYGGGSLALDQLHLRSGPSHLQVKGRVGETIDLNWVLESSDLASLIPEARGHLQGSGVARGALMEPHIMMRASGGELVYGQFRPGRLELNADLDLSDRKESRIRLALSEGRSGEIRIEHIDLAGKGRLKSHQLSLSARSSSGNIDLDLRGGMEDQAWVFRIPRAQLEYPELPAWSLSSAASGRIAKDRAVLSPLCFVSGSANFCAQGKRSPDLLEAKFSLDDFALDYLLPLLPPEMSLKGRVNGRGYVRQQAGEAPNIEVQIDTGAGRLVSEAEGEQPILAFSPSRARLDLGEDGLRVTADVRLEDTGRVELQAMVPPGRGSLVERPLSGWIKPDIARLDFISRAVPEVDSMEGRFTGELGLGGSLASPRFSGRLALTDGSVELVSPGLALSDVQFSIAGQGAEQLKIEGQAQSGGGRLEISGKAKLSEAGARADFQIKGQKFQVFNTPDARVFVSPDLSIALTESEVEVNGEVNVPRADITPKRLPESVVRASEDQIILHADTDQTPTPSRRLSGRVRIILGESVHFDGFGLNATFSGDILAVEEPGKPTAASGELMVTKGKYRAYGQNLDIETGRVIYAGGPLTAPALDVRAVRRPVTGILVGVQVRGSLKGPDFTLFSEPSMTQSEQLSYLVLGRPMDAASREEGSAVRRAAMALGVAGGELFSDKFGDKFGVDEIGIDTETRETGEEAALVIGKYLSPQLYVSYGLGLFESVSTLRVRYSINSRWRLVTETTETESGGDLLYTIERGQ